MNLPRDKLIKMLKKMLEIRHFEGAIHYVYAQGWMPGLAHLYIGQEAIAVGVCENLQKDDYLTSTHRGHGHLIAKGGDLNKMMAEVMGKATGYCKGKGGSMHIAEPELGIMGANGIVGGSIPAATGLGLSSKLKKDGKVVICFFGEGASNQGAFHEGINMGSLWHLPIVYVCENNLYGISVHQQRSQNIKDVAIRASAYGIPGKIVDGNDVLAVYDTAKKAINHAREGKGPTLIECKTYRWGGHHVGDPGTSYRPKEEVRLWKEKCPIKRFKALLIKEKIITQAEIDTLENEVKQKVDKSIEFARNSPYPEPDEALEDVFTEDSISETNTQTKPVSLLGEKSQSNLKGRELTYAQAISEALAEEMRRDEKVVVLGEDVAILGGNFRTTAGLYEEFGKERVFDTPISESGIIGCAIGLAMTGFRPVAELMFGDFVCVAMDQIVNQCAKVRYMTGGKINLPLVIRTNIGAGRSSAAQHSQSLHAWFVHTPGLKVIMPSSPFEVKGLLKSAIRDDDPVMVFEHKMLYNKKDLVPEEEYNIPIGKADVKIEGKDVTIIAISSMVAESFIVAEKLDREGISAEVIDLRSLVPIDTETIISSVKKTGRVVVVDEGVLRGGLTAEISASIMQGAFDYLNAPIQQVGNENTPIPFSPPLENFVRPTQEKIYKAVKRCIS